MIKQASFADTMVKLYHEPQYSTLQFFKVCGTANDTANTLTKAPGVYLKLEIFWDLFTSQLILDSLLFYQLFLCSVL